MRDGGDGKGNFTIKTPLHDRQFELKTMLCPTAQTAFWQGRLC